MRDSCPAEYSKVFEPQNPYIGVSEQGKIQ